MSGYESLLHNVGFVVAYSSFLYWLEQVTKNRVANSGKGHYDYKAKKAEELRRETLYNRAYATNGIF